MEPGSLYPPTPSWLDPKSQMGKKGLRGHVADYTASAHPLPWAKPSPSFWRFQLGVHVCVLGHFSRVRLFASPWTAAHQAPLSTGFFRQEYWSGLPFSSLGDLPHPGMEPGSPALAGGFFTTEPLRKPLTGIGPCKASLHTRDLFLKI